MTSPQIASNYQLLKIPQSNPATASGTIQLISPAGTYRCDSSQVQANWPGAAGTGVLYFRSDCCSNITQCTITIDGKVRGIYLNLGAAQLAYYQQHYYDGDQNNDVGANNGLTKKSWRTLGQLGNASANGPSSYWRLDHFFPHIFKPGQKYFTVNQQMTIQMTYNTIVGGSDQIYMTTANAAPNTTLSVASTPPTAVSFTLLLKLCPGMQEDIESQKIVSCFEQQQFFGSATSLAFTSNYNIPPNRVSQEQQIVLISAGPTAITFDEIADTNNVGVPACSITKNGYQIVQATSLSEARSQFALSADNKKRDCSNLIASFQDEFSNIMIQHNVNMTTVAAVNAYIGFQYLEQIM